MSGVIEVVGIGRTFGALRALEDVSLSMNEDQVHALIGPNGAGKSTLLAIIGGALAPSSGRVLMRGVDVSTLSADARARKFHLGRSFQTPSLFPELSCLDAVLLSAQPRFGVGLLGMLRRDFSRDAKDAAREALAKVGLAERAQARCRELSHGEKRQLEVAMILASAAEIVLLDEPLAGVSEAEGEIILSLLDAMRPGRTIVLVEHDVDAVFAHSDVVTVLHEGRLLASGAPDVIRRDPEVERAYTGIG